MHEKQTRLRDEELTPSPSPSFLMIFSPRAKNRHIIAGIVLGNRNPGNNDSLLSKAGIFYTGFGKILCSPFYSEQTNANFNPIHANLSSQIPAAAVLLRHSFQGNRIDSSARNVSLLQTNF